MLRLTLVVMLLMFFSLSCTTDSGDNFVETGTIVFLPFEGGFYGIKADNGKSYDPINLPVEFRKEGLRVRFEARELTGRASFHMWGIIVEIVHIQTL